MIIFLNSQGFISVRKRGEKIATIIDKKNEFLDNLKMSIKKYDLMVWVCNNADEFERNDKSAFFMAEAFKKQLSPFKEVVVLDNRNIDDAKDLLSRADYVYLSGGKLECQIDFLTKINFKKNINKDCVVVGVSAGAMNMCEIGYNYPEDLTELENKKYIAGLGYYNKIIIPHFKKHKGNKYPPKHYNLLKKWYLPDSYEKEFLALPNDSYVLLDEQGARLFGKAFKIKDGKVKRICKNGQILKLN